MTTKLFFQTVFLACVSFLFCGCRSAEEQKAATKPNILFIAVDDLRPELGCYGSPVVKSPNIDSLAGQGVLFDRAYCQTPLCGPSRASIMTGLRPNTSKVWHNPNKFRDTVPDAVTLSQYFVQNGYAASCVGKIFHNVHPDEKSWSEPKKYIDGFPFDPDAGYCGEENLAIIEEQKKDRIARGRKPDQFGQWYIKANVAEGPDVPDNAYYDGAQTDYAVDKIEQLSREDEPFFFAIGYYKPHLPFNAPKKYWDLYNREEIPLAPNPFLPENAPPMASSGSNEIRYLDMKHAPRAIDGKVDDDDARRLRHGYFACVSYVDAQIGRLLEKLDELGIRENTIIVLWGDHGWKLGEHRDWAKMTNYENDARVPLIISAPGKYAKGKKAAGMVEFVDVYPTLCELAGLSIPQQLDGESIVPQLKNPKSAGKKYAFTQLIRDKTYLPDEARGEPYMGCSVRSDRYRYVEWLNLNTMKIDAAELYDHTNDPQENKNVAGDPAYAAAVEEHAAQLAPGWESVKADPPKVKKRKK